MDSLITTLKIQWATTESLNGHYWTVKVPSKIGWLCIGSAAISILADIVSKRVRNG